MVCACVFPSHARCVAAAAGLSGRHVRARVVRQRGGGRTGRGESGGGKKTNKTLSTVCVSVGLLPPPFLLPLTPSPLLDCMLLSFRPAGADREGDGQYPGGKNVKLVFPTGQGGIFI